MYLSKSKCLNSQMFLSNCRKTEQQHNFFCIPFSFAETKLFKCCHLSRQMIRNFVIFKGFSICPISLTFLHHVFSNVSSNGLPEKRHSHIGCICLTFLHCALSNVSSKRLHNRMQSHIGCICLTFLHCAFSNVSSNCLLE